MTQAHQDAKTKLMDALREVLTSRKEAIRERLLSCLADHVEQELNELAEPPALDETLLATLVEGGLEAAPADRLQAPVAAPESPAAFAELQDAMNRVTQCGEQVGILENLMNGATSFSNRAVVFICRNGEAVGWEQSGFAANPYSMAIRGVTLSLQEESVLSQVVTSGQPCHGTRIADAQNIWTAIGTDPATEFSAIPLTVQGRIAAVLFTDNGCEEQPSPIQPEALTILARMAEMSLETMSLKAQMAAAMEAQQEAPAAPQPAPVESAPQESAPEESTSGETAAPEPCATEAPVRDATPEVTASNEPAAEVAAAPETDSVEEQTAAAEETPATPALSDDEDLHEQARRFARLLVSEILLYHPNEVQEGKLQHDLYERLRPDLERSEQMYKQRVAPEIAGEVDYFQEEVVRTLADGDASLLGN